MVFKPTHTRAAQVVIGHKRPLLGHYRITLIGTRNEPSKKTPIKAVEKYRDADQPPSVGGFPRVNHDDDWDPTKMKGLWKIKDNYNENRFHYIKLEVLCKKKHGVPECKSTEREFLTLGTLKDDVDRILEGDFGYDLKKQKKEDVDIEKLKEWITENVEPIVDGDERNVNGDESIVDGDERIVDGGRKRRRRRKSKKKSRKSKKRKVRKSRKSKRRKRKRKSKKR